MRLYEIPIDKLIDLSLDNSIDGLICYGGA